MIYIFENYSLDADRRELRRGAELIAVEPQVFDFLHYLIRERDRVVSKDDLVAAVWSGRVVSESAISSRITAVRQAIDDSGEAQRLIRTIPRKGLRFVGDVRENPRSADSGAARTVRQPEHDETKTRPVLLPPDTPSVAVLPFTNLSGDADQEYFADGIVEDIITELSRFSDLFVIARNSSFQYKGKSVDVRQVGCELGVRYVLEGSIRRSGDRVRISAQLIESVTGSHRWAERYDRKLEDIYAVQDEVVQTIVAILAAQVRKAETERILLKAPATWQAYDYYTRGMAFWYSYMSSFETQDLYKAQRLFERSFAIDATYARACAMLSSIHINAWFNPLHSDYRNPDALDRAYQMAQKAVQLDPYSPQAHATLGIVLARKGHHEASIAAFEKAIRLNPNRSDSAFAFALVGAGEHTRAIRVIEAHMRLDPFYRPLVPLWSGMAHYMLHRYSEAHALLRESVSSSSNSLQVAHIWLAACCAQMGQLDEARVEAAEVLRIEPGYTIDGTSRRLAGRFFKSPVDAEHLFDGLRKAGLPEK